MTTARSDALNEIIKTSLVKRMITIDDVYESLDNSVSRRTVRRAFKDAEEYNWIQKQGKNSKSWLYGETAREYQKATKNVEYPDEEYPIMYYVYSTNNTKDFFKDENLLVSAGAAWRSSGDGFTFKPPKANHLLVDSGGYQAATRFGDEYPYTPKMLHEWGDSIYADVVWGMDWACEDKDVLSNVTGVDKSNIKDWEWRYEKSWTDQVKQFEHYKNNEYDHEFRPVIQGHDIDDYPRFAKKLKESKLPHKNVGIGTVCKRSSNDEIHEVVLKIRSILPESNIHLFGATLNIYNDERFDGLFESSDTAAWLQHDPESGMYPKNEERAYINYRQKVNNTLLKS